MARFIDTLRDPDRRGRWIAALGSTERRRLVPALAATLALLTAWYGQRLVEGGSPKPWDVLLVYGVAFAIWWWAIRRIGSPADVDRRPASTAPQGTPAPWSAPRWRLAAVGVVLVVISTVLWPALDADGGGLAVIRWMDETSSENRWAAGGVLLWLTGIGLYVWAAADRSLPRWENVRRRARDEWYWWLLGAIALALGAYFRFHDLALTPGRMTSDHVEKLMDLHELVHEDAYRAYFPRNTGREPFQFYWTAMFSWIGGRPVSFLTLKAAMATMSLVGILATWRFARRVGGELTGVMAAFVIALAPWDIQITRVALRYELGAVFTALVMWWLLRGLMHGRRNDWLVAAALMAGGLNGYTAFRASVALVPAVIVTWLILGWWSSLRDDSSGSVDALTIGWWRHAAAGAGLSVLMVAPLLRVALDRPDMFWSRVLTRTTGAEAELATPWLQFLENWRNALLMVNWTSDGAFLINPTGRTALEPVGAALFALGIAAAIWYLWRADRRIAVTLVAMLAMMGPSTLALAFPGEVPHLARAGGALPAVATLAALPIPILVGRWRRAIGEAGVVITVLLVCLLLASMIANTHRRYFIEYHTNYLGSTHPTNEAAGVIRAFITLGGQMDDVYMLGWPNGWDYRALGVQTGEPDWNGLLGGAVPDWSDAVTDAGAMASDPARKLFFVAGPDGLATAEQLLSYYPDAVITRHPVEPEERSFYSVFAP